MSKEAPERSTFLASAHLRLDVVDVEKKLMHHRRYVIKVTLDKSEFTIKKKFEEIKKFLDVNGKKIDFGDLQAELRSNMNIRTKKQVEICQKIFNRINTLLRDPQQNEQSINFIKENIYSFVQSEELPSNSEEEAPAPETQPPEKKLSLSSFIPSTSPSVKMKKTLPFSECWAKLQPQGQWQFYRMWIKQSLLVLNLGVSDDYFYLKGCQVEVRTEPYYVLVISHKFDCNPLEIRINSIPNLEEDDPDEQLYQSYVMAYSFLKEMCISKQRIDAEVCGKYILKFRWAEIIQKQKDKENEVKQFFLRVTHEKISFSTGLYHLRKQLFLNLYIPLINPFGRIKIEMLTKSESWLHKDLVEVSLGQVQLLMQQVLTATYQLQPVIYKMPLSVSSQDESNIIVGHLKCEFSSFSDLKSHFVSNQLQNYEGESIQQELQDAREEIRMSANRIKRILYNVGLWKIKMKELSYFKHPYQSYLFYSFLIICFWIIESFFRTLLLAFLCITLATNEHTQTYISELLTVLHLKEPYSQLCELLQIKNQNFLEPKVRFKKAMERTEFLAKFEIKMKRGGNIFSKYKRLQQNLFMIRYAVLIVVGTVEKLKNLLNWTQPKKTLIFSSICLAAYIFVGNFPIRYLMIVGIVAIMFKKRSYYKTLYSYNRLVVYEVLRITAGQQNGEFNDFKQYLRQPTKQFDFSKSYMSHFQKKAIENFQNLTDIEVPANLFTENNSVNAVQNVLMTLPQRMKILKKYRRQLGLYDVHPSWFSDGSSSKRVMNSLYNFLYNIPSDRYLLEYEHDLRLKRLLN